MKSCIVLDLDATLVNTFGDIHTWKFIDQHSNDRIFDIKTSGSFLWGTKRPGVDQFLKACFHHFDMVGVWSAGAYDYVYKIVEEIFVKRPDFIWTRRDCVPTIFEEEEVVQKPLEKLFKFYPQINPRKTLIVDDYLDVCGQNSLYHVHVPAWRGQFDSINNNDDVLLRLARWLKELKNFEDYKFASPTAALR